MPEVFDLAAMETVCRMVSLKSQPTAGLPKGWDSVGSATENSFVQQAMIMDGSRSKKHNKNGCHGCRVTINSINTSIRPMLILCLVQYKRQEMGGRSNSTKLCYNKNQQAADQSFPRSFHAVPRFDSTKVGWLPMFCGSLTALSVSMFAWNSTSPVKF